MRRLKKWTFVVALVALAGTLALAEGQMEEPAADRVPVVATTNIVGDIVAQVGGDRLSLYVMLRPGADPHAFRATPRDARQAADAAVVFINGAGLEAGSTVAEPSARHLAGLREAIAEHEVPAIFVGLTVSTHVAQVVADDLGIEVVSVYTGSLSEPDGPAATYQDFIRTNVELIVAALAGS